MIILLGGNGYVGSAYRAFFTANNIKYISLSRAELDYSNTEILYQFLCEKKPSLVINAAGYTGKPNVDACELDKHNCLFGNSVLPGIVAEACRMAEVPLGHVSSGCIYTGGGPDDTGFTEGDDPNFTFRQDNCSFYSGTKALGEEVLSKYDNVYIWRLRIPFNNQDCKRNYITKLLTYEKLLNAINSISHLGEFVRATYQTWEGDLPTGIYNVTNPGSISAARIVSLIKKHRLSDKEFIFFDDESQFMSEAAKTPRSNCVMDSSKIARYGIKMTPVEECVERCLATWNEPIDILS